MFSNSDLEQMRADLAGIIGDHSVSITIDRAGTTLPAQTVRIERTGGTGRVTRPGSEEARGVVVVIGDTNLDIRREDTFTLDGQLYRVTFVRPNQQIGVQAEAELVQ